MKYEAENSQLKNEEAKLVVMRHFCSLAKPFLHLIYELVLGILLTVLAWNFVDPFNFDAIDFDNFSLLTIATTGSNMLYVVIWGAIAIAIIIVIIEFIVVIAQNLTRFLIVTDKRVLNKWGVFSKYEDYITFDKFDGATTLKPFKYRVFGCGFVIVNSTGARNIMFGPVKDPERVAETITETYSENKQ